MDSFIKKFGSLLICSLSLISLTAGQKVTIIPADSDVKKFVNDSYFVTCQPPQSIWTNPKGHKVESAPGSRVKTESESGSGVELYFSRIITTDSGLYTCTFKGSKASFNLTVIRPILFDQTLAEQSAAEGSNYKMRCTAQGQSPPKITWKVDHRNVQVSAKYKLFRDGLLIHNVQADDANKTYTCRAVDVNSPIPDFKSMNIVLRVKTKPKFLPGEGHNRDESQWGVMGEWANLTCAVKAEPQAKFEWVHKNRTLVRSDDALLFSDDNMSTLQVLVRSESKFGAYTCIARNELGVLEKVLILQRARKPLVPTLEPDLVGADGAKIRVKMLNVNKQAPNDRLGKELPITGYVVQYKMATRPEWKISNVTRYDGGFTIAELNPNINYQVRAALKNKASVGEFSKPIQFQTLKTAAWKFGVGGAPILNNYPILLLVALAFSTYIFLL